MTTLAGSAFRAKDRTVLRRLAARVAELAARPIEAEKRELWTTHNDLEGSRPLIFCDPENSWREILPDRILECESPLARGWEWHFRREIFWGEEMGDDRVVQGVFNIAWVGRISGWGAEAEDILPDQHGGAKRWIPPIDDLNDLRRLRFPTVTVDRAATEQLLETARSLFGDLLTVRLRAWWFWTLGLTQTVIRLRGMDRFFMDMIENPEGVHRLMAFLRDGTAHVLDVLEEEGLFTLNQEGDYVGSGAFGWTRQLPAAGFSGKVRCRDLWCLGESQETVGVSPEMFDEFVFSYQEPLLRRFGLVCYGCCEPVHDRWHSLARLPNLRRVSVSPWCDRAAIAKAAGDRVILSVKPNPALLAMDHFDEALIRQDIRDALEKMRGGRLEFVMKDNHTIRNDPERVKRWCRIVREEIA
jgi:hypothetical protein